MVQRFWLEATRLGLQFQPEMTPLIFSRYASQDLPFSESAPARARAGEVWDTLREAFLGGMDDTSRLVYMGRLGSGVAPRSRSVRKSARALSV